MPAVLMSPGLGRTDTTVPAAWSRALMPTVKATRPLTIAVPVSGLAVVRSGLARPVLPTKSAPAALRRPTRSASQSAT